MTTKEGLLAAMMGESVSPKPELRLPFEECGLRVLILSNPYGLALREGFDLTANLRADPEHGAKVLDAYAQSVRSQLQAGVANGAELIVYQLFGAEPTACTPMEYGGYYLEKDRELLTECRAFAATLLFVCSAEGAYFDFLSDLPAHAFGWDANASGVPVSAVRAIRPGPLVSNDPEADVLLVSNRGVAGMIASLEGEVASANA